MKDGKIIYLDGKVLVNDFKKDSKNPVELKEYEYQDNIKELIKEENIVEELENLKNELSNKIIKRNNTINHYSSMKKMLLRIFVITAIIGSILLSGFAFANDSFNLISSILRGSVAGTSIPLFVCGFLILSSYNEKRYASKEKTGFELQLEEIEKELVKNKEILNQLQNNKSKENEQEAMNKKTDNIHNIHLEEYRKIRHKLWIYRELGENEDKFLKYYKNGTLEENLDETYEPEEIEKIKTYFKSKK